MSQPYFSLVIPAFNEGPCIADTLARSVAALEAQFPSWEIIVVDDGSTDDTADTVARTAASDTRVRLLRRPHAGKGASVRHGMLQASGQWRFLADADLSMDLDQLPKFFEAGGDVVIASRVGPGAERVGESWSRQVAGRSFNGFVQLVALPDVRDTQCGFKLFSADAAVALFQASRINGFAFDVELLFLARRCGMTVREVPIVWRQARRGRINPAAGASAVLEVLRIRFNDAAGLYRPLDEPFNVRAMIR